MTTKTITLTAAEAVRAGMCDGKCLVASERQCTCRCGGAYHGVLADQPIGTVTLAPVGADRAAAVVAAELGSGVRTITAPAMANRSRRTVDPQELDLIVDQFAEGRAVRAIATDLGFSESTVRKQLKSFAGGA